MRVEIDLDDPTYPGPQDVEACAVRWLLATEDPQWRTRYRGRPDLAATVAPVAAKRASRVVDEHVRLTPGQAASQQRERT